MKVMEVGIWTIAGVRQQAVYHSRNRRSRYVRAVRLRTMWICYLDNLLPTLLSIE